MANITQVSGRGTDRRKRFSVHIDMTPMVDLAFLLLTFFVLTTSLNKQFIMALTIPDDKIANPPPIPAKRVITLLLGKGDNIYWYQGYPDHPVAKTDYSKDGVRRLLRLKSKEIEKMTVLIKPTRESRYKNVVDIVDELAILKIDRYAMDDVSKEELILLTDYKQ